MEESSADRTVLFYVNGKEVRLENPDPEMTLLSFIRNNLHLSGTKDSCGGGGCGVCTVMASQYCRDKERISHFTVNSCLAPICSVDGMAITTVEGIGSTQTSLHPCQERIARSHGSQCGFCTPGFVMSMYTLLRNNPQPTEAEIEEAFQGNLCRCTGYRPILDGYKTFAKCCSDDSCGESSMCCKNKEPLKGSSMLFDSSKFIPLRPTQEPIFPPALKLQAPAKSLAVRGPRVQWFRPVTMKELLYLRAKFPHHSDGSKPQYRIVMGNTGIGTDAKFKGVLHSVLIHACAVPELRVLESTEEGLVVGSATTITQLMNKLSALVEQLPEFKVRSFAALLKVMKRFAGPQIRNVSVVGGHICNASSTSDLNPVFIAAGATLQLASATSQRTVAMDSEFFVSHKQTCLKPDEVAVSVLIPYTRENEFVDSFKQSRRRDLDTAIVNAGLRVLVEPGSPHWTVKDCTLSYGCMSDTIRLAEKTQKALLGKSWCESTFNDACSLLLEDFPLQLDAPGGMAEYRLSLVISFFFKFYLAVLSRVSKHSLASELVSATENFHKCPVSSAQAFQECQGDAVGRPMMHLSALEQATGEARYVDDKPRIEGELHGALVLSSHAHAEIQVDPSDALQMEGVVEYISVKDIPSSNNVTGLFMDEEIFAENKVTHFGQPIGMVVAANKTAAQRAAKAVKITYSPLPSIITIEDAVEAGSYMKPDNSTLAIEDGDVEAALTAADRVVEGEIRVGDQEHYYLETHGCIAIPKNEKGEMEIIASSQGIGVIQKMVALALNIPANRISASVKRIGGGFGGKGSRAARFAVITAVAAHKLCRPVRLILERDEDMIASGHRQSILGKYKVGFTSEGLLTALDVQLYSNGGNAIDLSENILQKSLRHLDNVYKIPNVRFTGFVCQTNLPPNSAMRGLGIPQTLLITEQILDHVAHVLKTDVNKVKELNMYKDGDTTPYKQPLSQCNARKCWHKLQQSCEFIDRTKKIEEFNRENQCKKRGMAVVPIKNSVGFFGVTPYQAGALLHVYTDGSVLLTHGGIEMGQGLHTKMVQVCSRCLGIPTELIFISETSSTFVPNASGTGASISTDLYGMAVKSCCDQIMARLQPYINADAGEGWKHWVSRAYSDRVNLSAQGFFATPLNGHPFSYFAYGCGCSEVEVDTLTGDFVILRTDLVMDVGDSINPAIDIGQVEGAFMQGVGLYTMEQCVYLEGTSHTQRGQPFTTGPATYKIPSCSDIPTQFNVALLDRAPNPHAIFSSKGIGEPPLPLAASVFFAIKNAIKAARAQNGVTDYFQLNSPATCERIRMACSDCFTEQVCAKFEFEVAKRWSLEA